MPYKHWEVAPEGLNHTRLTLAGALVQVVVDIKVSWHVFFSQDYRFSLFPFQDRVCTLLEHSEESPVSHLIGQPMTACQLLPVKPLYRTPFSFTELFGLLLQSLKKCGINFTPESDGHKYCKIRDKVCIDLLAYKPVKLHFYVAESRT